MLIAVPVALAPGMSALAAPAPAPGPGTDEVIPADSAAASVMAGAQVRPAPAGQKVLPRLRWAQYMAQKPTWTATNCSAEARDIAAAGEGKPLAVECARLRTPLDWNDLSKGSITLNVTRLKGTGKGTARGLFVNPGGPGGAAGGFVAGIGLIKPALRTTHDIVGVDPRGAGLSTPLVCNLPTGTPADQRNVTKAVRDATWRGYKKWVQDCTAKQGAILPYITTANTVADMDMARRVMGYPAMDFYGVSGGSWMGAWMAELRPGAVGRMVVDANTQFTSDWRTSFSHMPKGFQRRWDSQVVPWIARHHKDFGMGTTAKVVRANYEKVRAEVGKGRVTGLDPASLDAFIMTYIYDDQTLPMVASMLGELRSELASTRGKVTLPVPDGAVPEADSQLLATVTVRTAIICNDTAFDRRRESLEAEYLRAQKAYPLQGAMLGVITGPCAYWPYTPAAAPKIDGAGSAPMLMVQTELDPATPIEGARIAHAGHSATRMVTVDDDGNHGGVLTAPLGGCVDKAVLGYLQKGTMPATDLTCQGAALPLDSQAYEVVAR